MQDDESVHSVSTEGQLSFWSLTGAFMLKLIAFVLTIFILPFNEWIVSEARANNLVFMRGISGSDCVKTTEHPNGTSCIRWSEEAVPGSSAEQNLWARVDLQPQDIQQPSSILGLIYYLIICQIAVFVLDLGATTIMCCRYRTHKSSRTAEKRLSLAFCLFIFFVYVAALCTMISAKYAFVRRRNVELHFGTAFKLLLVAISIFLLGWAMSNITMCFRSTDDETERRWIQLEVVERWQRLVSRRRRRQGHIPGAGVEATRLRG